MTNSTEHKKVAFLNVFMGGTGALAGQHFQTLHESDGKPFVTLTVHLDTDPQQVAFADRQIHFPLDAGALEIIKGNARLFGSIVERIVQEHGELLNAEDTTNGSRTIRLLTQLAFLFHRNWIGEQFRACLLDLKKRGTFDIVVPIFISSSSGGAGSALQILLAQALRDPAFREQLCIGLADDLQTPIGFVAEAYAQADRHQPKHADRIYANAYAFREESAILERQRKFKYLFHIGLSNNHGRVLHSLEEIGKVLGTSVYEFERNWEVIKSTFVNDLDGNTDFYTGLDTFEKAAFADERRSAPLASTPLPRFNPGVHHAHDDNHRPGHAATGGSDAGQSP